jgi:energy-coupling factor transporter ATP-binding protein EcfA2
VSNYQHLRLQYGQKEVEDSHVIANLEKHGRIVITGLAGSGKSMLMKYLTISKFEDTGDRVPVFVELRHLNQIEKRDLLIFIRLSCTGRQSKVTQQQFELSLIAGALTLILDGFDELNYDFRDGIQKQILELARNFPKTVIVVSSRPDERFGGWASFHVFKVNPLRKKDALSLISGLDYDVGVKKRFARVVKENLYETHESFLSSPLLITIMLLTYEQFAEIPDKMHIFYGQAFDTLFHKHDAQKEQYKRKIYTGLAKDDFKNCVAAFSAMGYMNDFISFEEHTLLETAKKAVSYLQNLGDKSYPNLTAETLISDMRESVCLLQQDGIETTYVHRSFQEYFASLFATSVHTSKTKSILDHYARRFGDSVLRMALDMDRDTVEQSWVLPEIKRLRVELLLDDADANLAVQMSKLMPTFRVLSHAERMIISWDKLNMENVAPIAVILDLYSSKFVKKRHPLDIISAMPRNNSISRLVDPAFEGKHNYHLFFDFADAERLKKRETNFHIKITPKDDWWLRELGLTNVFRDLKRGFDQIYEDIEKRDRLRTEILTSFVSPTSRHPSRKSNKKAAETT